MVASSITFFGWIMFFTMSFLVILFIQGLMFKRAVFQVIRIFRENRSFCSEKPKKVEELGLQPTGYIQRMFRRRDYKPYALQAMIKQGIVRLTEDGKVCLLKDKVAESLRGK